MLTAILPCAGLGTRLGLPYPKEIHRVVKSHSLIDFSLGHIKEDAERVERVVTVLAKGKEVVFDYVQDRCAQVCATESCYFNENYYEWPGSIRSAEHMFGDRNIALLPDSVLVPSGGTSLVSQFSDEFEKGADLVFAYVPTTDRVRLSALGALVIDNGNVSEFCDKPALEYGSQFNGFWASFGFTKECSAAVLEFMTRSVAREAVDINELGLNVRAFPIKSYTDLGTWPAMSKFLSSDVVLT